MDSEDLISLVWLEFDEADGGGGFRSEAVDSASEASHLNEGEGLHYLRSGKAHSLTLKHNGRLELLYFC